MRRHLAISCALGLLLAPACVKENFEKCKKSDDCDEGFLCPQAGPLEGRCAKPCESDRDCENFFGDAYACVDDVCTSVCAYKASSFGCSGSPGIESCTEGLSCRSESPNHCASFCTVDSWPGE